MANYWLKPFTVYPDVWHPLDSLDPSPITLVLPLSPPLCVPITQGLAGLLHTPCQNFFMESVIKTKTLGLSAF